MTRDDVFAAAHGQLAVLSDQSDLIELSITMRLREDGEWEVKTEALTRPIPAGDKLRFFGAGG